MKRLLLTAVALGMATSACVSAEVHFNAGQTLTFRNPYKTGCRTLDAADEMRKVATRESQSVNLTDAEVQTCFGLLPDKPYRIAEVTRYNNKEFYRVSLSSGELVWTYVLSSRDVHEAIAPGTRFVLEAPNYACNNIDAALVVARGVFVASACYTLAVGIEFEVQQVRTSSDNWYRFACLAPYKANVPYSPDRPCDWTRME